MSKKRGNMRKLFFNSKSQASIFIIISLIIILLGVLYFFYQRQAVEKEIGVLHPAIAPIKLYVDNCIKSAAEDGLERIGLSGGYISIPESINNNQRAYLSAYAAGFKMPYWWYDGIDAIPEEEFIRQQLASHIKAEIRNCIDDFEPFNAKFEINQLKEPFVDIQFNDNDVSIKLTYPLEIISNDGTLHQLIQNFNYAVPIRFKKIYELAKLVMERENKEYFLEKRTIDLYSMSTGIPTTDVEATCKTKVWQLSGIKEELKNLLRVNLPYIRIKGTDYNENLYVPNPSGANIYAETYFQKHYVWEIDKDNKKYRNMKVSFAYEDWPLEIYARPSQNGILRSNSQTGTDILAFFCLHIWHFTYDINYPVLVTIFDGETDSNRAYQFSFAFKANINHNQPERQSTGSVLFETFADVPSDEYCSALQNEVTIFTVDNSTGDDIKDVNLTFACGRFYCDMGKSEWLSFGAAAGLTRRFPYCVYGVIKGAKNGYDEAKSFIQTDVDGSSYVLMLNPVRELQNYKVVKHQLANPSIYQELGGNERASILVKGKDTAYESFAVYPKEEDFALRLPDGKDAAYDVNVYLIDEENIVGGYIGEWRISKEALNGANEAVFHVIEQGAATDDERFLFISGLNSYSKNVPAPELR